MRRSVGNITPKGHDRYLIKISLGKDSEGRYRQKLFTYRGTKKGAENRLAEIITLQSKGAYTIQSNIKFGEYLKRWLADYAKPNLSPRGYERYESLCRVHIIPALCNIQLSQLKPEHISKHYTAMLNKGLSPLTVRYHHVVIHKALQTAMKWGLITRNVSDGVDIPKSQRREMQTWDELEVNAFLETAKDTPYYALFYTALYTGARRSELLALRWQDIDFIYGQIYVNRGMHHLRDGTYKFTVPKTNKSRRTIALPPTAFLVLETYRKAREIEYKMIEAELKDSDLVFSALGKPLRPNTVSRAWVMLAVKAGVKVIRLHDARHTYASLMLKQGIHPKIVQERLGHSTISITLDTYSHVAPGLQEAAAKRFDDMIQIKHNISVIKSN